MRYARLVIGFDGDPWLVARIREALLAVASTFPEHLAKSQPPTWFEPTEMAQNELFDALVRAHKKDRLAMPIQALLRAGAPHHNFELMLVRRLAWFVPSLVSAWLDRPGGDLPSADLERIFASTAEVEGPYWAWTEEEEGALATLFGAALDAALATPLPPPCAPDRPLEDGVQVWSFHAPSVPLDVLRAAKALHVDLDPLVLAWVNEESALALEHLLEAVFDPTFPAKRVLAYEPVADRLGDAFFEATGERAVRFSRAEVHVRRWIARREDDDPFGHPA